MQERRQSPEAEAASEPEELAVNGLCPVVGIGASAGGLEAFTQLLRHLPENTGMAFVLVQHLDPRYESVLSELLANHTAMPVDEAAQGTKVHPNHVYIIPPNTQMAIRQGVLQLTPRESGRARHLPIDYFLCSLAEDQKGRALGVILSGSASDGTLGLKAIKDEGGITFAQDASAKFDSMPSSAVAAGAVDYVLPPEGIARELARVANLSFLAPAGTSQQEGPLLQMIFSLLRAKVGVDFTHYKRPTMQRRIARRMALTQCETLGSYLRLLEEAPQEVQSLLEDLLINVTEFFRDPAAFDALPRTAFRSILNNRSPEEPIRIWVPACSSGEEVYSIAICLSEYLETLGDSFPIQIFGTDLSQKAIETARSGKYPDSIATQVSPERLNRYFHKLESGGYLITRSIRDACVFSLHDITKDPPISRMDLISCRNLLIYFDSVLQRRVISIFEYALRPSGCLLLGNAETLGSLTDHFIALDRDHKIFSRNLQAAQTAVRFEPMPPAKLSSPVSLPPNQDSALVLIEREADRIISAQYGPAGVLVDARRQVLRFRGRVAAYILPTAGPPSLELFRLVREDLVLALRSLIDEAALKNVPVRREQVQVRRNDRFEAVNLIVWPIEPSGAERCFLVLFEEPSPHDAVIPAASGQNGLTAVPASSLEQELITTRNYLQSLIEELRTSNKEALCANEELQSTNEELQTAKEELQSSNEELTTTNDEMKSRNVELSQVNNDLINLLSSTQIPIVMLNKELRIRSFTPKSEKALNLIRTDIGRPITDLNPRIQVPDLEHLLSKVILSRLPIEQDVQDQEGHWYSMRINPYRTADNRVEGAVLQFVDIDQLKLTLQATEQAREFSEAIFSTVREPLVVLDPDLRVQTANHAFFETFSLSPGEVERKNIFELGNRQWDLPKVHQLLEGVATGRAPAQDVELEHKIGAAGWRTFQLNARVLKRDGASGQILLALQDVSDRKRAAEAKFRRLFEAAKDGILMIEADTGEITDANAFFLDLFGYKREELAGKLFWEAGPLQHIPGSRRALDKILAEEIVRYSDLTLPTTHGHTVDVEAIANVYTEGDKRVIQFNVRDITERKQFDQRLRQSAKLESLGLLAGGVAHDFNNLLTGIMGNASLALDNAREDSPDREQLREIVKATQKAADLTRQMLAYSGRGRFVVGPVDISEAVEEMIPLIRSSIPRTVEINLDLARGLPPVEADATQIQQLVMNLVINGAEAIPEGKRGVVLVRTAQQELDPEKIRQLVSGEEIQPGRYATIEVSDTGTGMDEATKSRIFDPFFTTKFTGRGLGLAAVSGIMRSHRGAVTLDSAPGRGTTFKVYFPAVPAKKVRKASKRKLRDLRGQGLVLIADDEEMVLNLASAALGRYGYQVLTATNGADAVQLVRERAGDIDLVILDLTMPVMSGEDALEAVKAIRPDLPVILSSGYDESQAMERFADYDLAAFVQKPYSVEKLLSTIKDVLS